MPTRDSTPQLPAAASVAVPACRGRYATGRAVAFNDVGSRRRPASGPDPQALEPPDDVVRLPARFLDELEVREAVHQRRERDLELLAAERRPEAEVDPGAEREVRIRVSGQVELVRLRRPVWVPVSGAGLATK